MVKTAVGQETMDISKLKKWLLAPRVQRSRWLLLLATLPTVLIALIGWKDGACLYLIFAIPCLVQLVRPTLLGWMAAAVPALALAGFYSVLLATHIAGLTRGGRFQLSVGLDDKLTLSLFTLLVVGVTAGLMARFPRLPVERTDT